MEVIKSIPRGYCHGVVTALNITSKAIAKYKEQGNVYILGEIVHNKKITNAYKDAGAITLTGNSRAKLLEQIDSGTVIITAHGIDPNLIIKAEQKGLNVIDATCKDVYKTHKIIKNYLAKNYSIIYIGKKKHPEPEGILGINPEINLITSSEDIEKLNINNSKILVTNQTTLSKYDLEKLFNKIKKKYPQSLILEEICTATSQRQEIALKNSKISDLSIVVGDKKSNNTLKLVEICQELGNCQTYRIDTVEDIKIEWFEKVEKVHITAGASTPTMIIKEVIDFLELYDKKNKKTWNTKSKIKLEKIIPRIRY